MQYYIQSAVGGASIRGTERDEAELMEVEQGEDEGFMDTIDHGMHMIILFVVNGRLGIGNNPSYSVEYNQN